MIFNVKIGGNTYTVGIDDLNKRPVIAHIGDESFEVWPETESRPATRPQVETGPGSGAQPQANGLPSGLREKSIHSPLPGTVVDIHIQPGSLVQAGEPLLVIEAMKMKNAIRASGGGTVAAVHVSLGQTVQHRQLLVEFE